MVKKSSLYWFIIHRSRLIIDWYHFVYLFYISRCLNAANFFTKTSQCYVNSATFFRIACICVRKTTRSAVRTDSNAQRWLNVWLENSQAGTTPQLHRKTIPNQRHLHPLNLWHQKYRTTEHNRTLAESAHWFNSHVFCNKTRKFPFQSARVALVLLVYYFSV